MPKEKSMTLREARGSRSMTIEELAKRAGISFSTAQGIESGRLKGSFMAKIKIADVLDLPARVIFPDLIEEFDQIMELQKKDQARAKITKHKRTQTNA
jgi:transcriptional regulator with XRE-family HTH domain